MASSTSWAGSICSVPATGSKRPSFISTSTSSSASTLPSLPTKRWVLTENTRSPPSSCALEVRSISGQVGHGVDSARVCGGSGMISSCVTDAAPWRCAVPRQSAPVSPPPMMTTCLPSAVMGQVSRSPSCTRLAGTRYSIARWMPSSSRPGAGRSRPSVEPPASTTAS